MTDTELVNTVLWYAASAVIVLGTMWLVYVWKRKP